MNSIWRTVEAFAWMRGYSYEDYEKLQYEKKVNLPISRGAYRYFCNALDKDMEDKLNADQVRVPN